MAFYSASVITNPAGWFPGAVAGTSTSCAWDLKAYAQSRPKLTELSQSNYSGNNSTAAQLLLGRITVETTQINQVQLSPDDPNDPMSTNAVASLWTTAPTAPVQFLRRVQYAGSPTTGGFLLSFPRGITIEPLTSLGLFFLSPTLLPTGAMMISCQTEE